MSWLRLFIRPAVGAALLLAVPIPQAGAVVRRDDQPDSAYRAAGNAAAFRSVGRVEVDYGGGYQALGTATLYGRDRLVSAAHVFDDDALGGARRLRINFGRAGVRTIDFRREGVINLNPNYDAFSLRNDVAVVFLPRRMNLAPARLYSGRRLSLEKKISFVGFGNTGTGLTGSREISSVKRAGENALGRYRAGGRNFEVDFDDPFDPGANSLGDSRVMRLEGLLGAGDSGGSAWVRAGNRWRLIGINSYGEDWNADGIEDNYGDRSGFVYLPGYEKWMNSLKGPNGGATERSLSFALAPVPEPGTVGLLLAGGGAAFFAWRRRKTRS